MWRGALLAGYLPPASLIAQGLKPALPFAALFLLLLFWPGLRNRREVTDPLAGADPPPPSLAAATRSALFSRSTHILGVVFVAVVVYLALGRADDFWLSLLTQALVFSLIFLSITVITGMAGQISLCQATFAGIGAVTTAQFVSALGSNVLLGMVVGAAWSRRSSARCSRSPCFASPASTCPWPPSHSRCCSTTCSCRWAGSAAGRRRSAYRVR